MSTSDTTDTARRVEVIEEAHDMLRGYSFIDGPGMAVHAPMAVEALTSLGLHDMVGPWVAGYTARHAPLPAPPESGRIDPHDPSSCRAALGDPSRLTDWVAAFDELLAEGAWGGVVGRWVPHLMDGFAGALTHGLLRTAHAVRALEGVSEPSRPLLKELAMGLAFWAGTFKPLPGSPELRGTLELGDAIAAVPRPNEPWTPMEAGQMSRIDELPRFGAAVEDLGPPQDRDVIGEMTLAFARFLVANPQAEAIALVHTITPAAATRSLLAYVATSVETLYAQLWRVNAAIVAGSTQTAAPPSTPTPDTLPSLATLVERAAEHRDPHVVKLTEACVREHALRPDPAYLLAAHHVLTVTAHWSRGPK